MSARKEMTMKKHNLRRRDLLAGLGLGGVFLAPFARSVKAWAAAPKGKFIFMHTPNGMARSLFGSDGDGAAFKFRNGCMGLEPIREQTTTIRGLTNKSQLPKPFHDQITRLLTCVRGNSIPVAAGPSIDQVIAKTEKKQALNLKVYRSFYRNVGTYEDLSWSDKGVKSMSINDPREAYKLAFGDFMPGGGAEVDNLIDQKRSMLDFLTGEITTFRNRLTGDDRNRLDAHLNSVRSLEMRLGALSPMDATVASAGGMSTLLADAKKAGMTAPPRDGGPGAYDLKAFSDHGDVQMDILTAAIATGARNAGTLMWQGAASGANPLGGQGQADDHHWVSHGDAPFQVWSNIDKYYSGKLNRMAQKLKDAGVLDRTVIVWGSEISEQHSHDNHSFVTVGGKALGMQTMKTFSFNGASLSDLWVSVQNACGIPSPKFGENSNGGIPGLWKPA